MARKRRCASTPPNSSPLAHHRSHFSLRVVSSSTRAFRGHSSTRFSRGASDNRAHPGLRSASCLHTTITRRPRQLPVSHLLGFSDHQATGGTVAAPGAPYLSPATFVALTCGERTWSTQALRRRGQQKWDAGHSPVDAARPAGEYRLRSPMTASRGFRRK